jgi:hypothetical protein
MGIMKWISGIATAVLIAVIIFYAQDTLRGWLYKPDVKISFFDMHRPEGDNRLEMGYEQGDRVGATINVVNAGRSTAEDCRIYWQSDGLGWRDALYSPNPFSLLPNEKMTEKSFETFVSDKWTCPNSPGVIDAQAWVECENCHSEKKIDSISAGPLCAHVAG